MTGRGKAEVLKLAVPAADFLLLANQPASQMAILATALGTRAAAGIHLLSRSYEHHERQDTDSIHGFTCPDFVT